MAYPDRDRDDETHQESETDSVMAEAFPDGSHVAHIGLPKTGTTTLQRALDAARESLVRHGVAFVNPSHHAQSASKAAVGELRPWHNREARRRWEEISAAFRESNARCTVLSSETLSGAKPRDVEGVVDALGRDIQVVVTLRSPALMLPSSWQQTLRRGRPESYPEWLKREFHPDRRSDDSILHGRKGVHRFIEVWGKHVGQDALTFVIGDPADRRSLLTSFEGLLGLPEGLLPTPSRDNSSLPFPEAELMRSFNAAFADAGGDKVLWMKTLRSTNRPLAQAQSGFRREPVPIPAWAVTRANELTERWIEALDASGATVVGNPEHLFAATESSTDEVVPPTSVSIDSAGVIAHILYQAGLRGGEKLAQERLTDQPDGLRSVSTGELLAEVRRRAARRLRRD